MSEEDGRFDGTNEAQHTLLESNAQNKSRARMGSCCSLTCEKNSAVPNSLLLVVPGAERKFGSEWSATVGQRVGWHLLVGYGL